MGVLKIWDEGLQRWVVIGPDPDDDPGITDHGDLDGLADDDHPQYARADGSRGEFEAKGAVGAHEAKPDPHPQYLTQAEGDARYYTEAETDSRLAGKADKSTQVSGGQGLTGGGSLSQNRTLDVGQGTGITVGSNDVSVNRTVTDTWYDAAGTAQSRVSQHEAAPDPHPQYLTSGEYDETLDGKVDKTTQVVAGQGLSGGGQLSQNRTLNVGAGLGIEVTLSTVDVDRSQTDTWYDAKGAAASGDAAHVAAGDPHTQYLTEARGDARFDAIGTAAAGDAAHVAEGDPHPQYLTEDGGDSRYLRQLLTDSIWWVDAGSMLPDGTGLKDLTGNGRDLVFAPGSEPAVLPHTGEDYVRNFRDAVQTPQGLRSIAARTGWTTTAVAEFDMVLHAEPETEWAYLVSDDNATGIRVDLYRSNFRLFYPGGNVFTAVALPIGQRFQLRVEYDAADGITVLVDGSEAYRNTTPITPNPAAATSYRTVLAGAYGTTRPVDASLYRFSYWKDGALEDEMLPSNASADYTAIANTGSAGADWAILRAATGFKTAVVDRPLLLFGGAQYATADGLGQFTQDYPELTVCAAYRIWGTSNNAAFIITTKSTNTSARGFTFSTSPNGLKMRAYRADGTNEVQLVTEDGGLGSGQYTTIARFSPGDSTLFHEPIRLESDTPYTTGAAQYKQAYVGGTATGNWADMELIGLAVFERSLSDDECLAVSREMRGMLQVATGQIADGAVTEAKISDGAVTDAKLGQSAIDRVLDIGDDRYVKKLLTEAVWHVDAGSVASDRLLDLTGNGRDAVFGAGNDKPIVLPHDGEDYLFMQPAGTYSTSSGSNAIPAPTTKVRYEVDLAQNVADLGYAILSNGLHTHLSLYLLQDGRIRFYTEHGAHNTTIFLTQGQRYSLAYEYSSDGTIQLWVGGVLEQTLSTPAVTRWPTTMNFRFANVANIYSLKVFTDGSASAAVDCDFSNHNDYTRVTNNGSAGGYWAITRASSGYKTAVVDRPVLLFGGNSGRGYATSSLSEPIPYGTVIYAHRTYYDASTSRYMASMSSETPPAGLYAFTPSAASGMQLRAAAGGSILSPASHGQKTWAMSYTGESERHYINGALTQTYSPRTGDMFVDFIRVGSLAYNSQEFIAAAIFPRALTDDEVARASEELLGNSLVTEDIIADGAVTDAKIGGSLAPIISDPVVGQLSIGGVEMGDTGWRSIPLKNGWASTGQVVMRRQGSTVYVRHIGAVLDPAAATSDAFMSLSAGFRPSLFASDRSYVAVGGQFQGAEDARFMYVGGGGADLLAPRTVTYRWFTFAWPTDDPWPTTLPGTQVTPPAGN